MIIPTPQELKLLENNDEFAELLLTVYEPFPKLNPFNPQANKQRIDELKDNIKAKDAGVPSPSQYRSARKIAATYIKAMQSRPNLNKAAAIADLLSCKDDKTIRQIESILDR